VCTVTGTISGHTTPVLRDTLTKARRDDNTHLVIGLSTVTSMDATGLYVLFEALGNITAAVTWQSSSTLIPQPSMNCTSLL
jgi:anti-anti-sigma factor